MAPVSTVKFLLAKPAFVSLNVLPLSVLIIRPAVEEAKNTRVGTWRSNEIERTASVVTFRHTCPPSSDLSNPSVVPAKTVRVFRGSRATKYVRKAPIGVGSLFQCAAPSALWYKPLQALGMKRAFQIPDRKDGAQFEGMTDAKDPMEKLYLARVLHKAFIEVNEKGAEAAAATGGVSSAGSDDPMIPFIPEFKAERPFVFLIRDRQSGSILFLGRIVNPKD